MGVPNVGDLLKILQTFNAGLTLSAFEFFSDVALQKVRDHRSLPAPLSQPEAFMLLWSLMNLPTVRRKLLLRRVWKLGG